MRRLIALFLALPLLASAAGPSVAPFSPNSAATVTVAVTTVSGSTRVALVGGGTEVIITNAGPSTAFMELGTSTATAAVATGFPLLAGEIITLGLDSKVTHVVAITSSSTATVYVTTGEGS
jgi:hypothetical protein